ncbi:MAG: class I SAM-dependent methyltransferase [Alphaproteobacteria bacterium]|jgi:SAM-dependent methyltransferase|nr:class I SAM-dependent methyltransferase [Alphaproteobacteria bacterium]
MSDPLRRRDDCRLCGSGSLGLALSLAPTPPANAFVSSEHCDEPQALFPLDLHLCGDCGHLQLLDVVDPEELFADYIYVSGTSPAFVDHFRDYAAALSARAGLGQKDLVVDIGSNDGTMLGFFKAGGQRVLGIDPAREIAARANDAGIETLVEFFTVELAERERERVGPARAITANNVFAHIDDLAGVADGVRTLLAPDGLFAFEVSYLMDVIEKTLFDTIYHEHLDYHALGPLVPFFAARDMEVVAAERVASHGGSIRVFVQHAGGPHRREAAVEGLIEEERARGLGRLETFHDFAERIDRLKGELVDLLSGLGRDGMRIAGFGAPAKATTLLHHFELGGELEFIVDDSPLKQGLYTPGHHIPVVASEELYKRMPDYTLILAWNFAAPIMANHQDYTRRGGRFIVPIPEVKVTP